jgi:SnoaL-like protein
LVPTAQQNLSKQFRAAPSPKRRTERLPASEFQIQVQQRNEGNAATARRGCGEIRDDALDDATLTVKITWVIVREDGDWKIVNHHVSSKAPLIDRVR